VTFYSARLVRAARLHEQRQLLGVGKDELTALRTGGILPYATRNRQVPEWALDVLRAAHRLRPRVGEWLAASRGEDSAGGRWVPLLRLLVFWEEGLPLADWSQLLDDRTRSLDWIERLLGTSNGAYPGLLAEQRRLGRRNAFVLGSVALHLAGDAGALAEPYDREVTAMQAWERNEQHLRLWEGRPAGELFREPQRLGGAPIPSAQDLRVGLAAWSDAFAHDPEATLVRAATVRDEARRRQTAALPAWPANRGRRLDSYSPYEDLSWVVLTVLALSAPPSYTSNVTSTRSGPMATEVGAIVTRVPSASSTTRR
jgi:hypothetical protein